MPMLGNKYSIQYTPHVLRDDIPTLPKTMRLRIQKAIETRLTVDPINLGKALRHSLKGCYRLRVGDYRVLYTIAESRTAVIIVSIKHRAIVYDEDNHLLT
jgi:mRNA interferase RelE/StbE